MSREEILANKIAEITAIGKSITRPKLPNQPRIPNLNSDNLVVAECSDARPDLPAGHPDQLVGCNNAELQEASAGTLSCPKLPDTIISDEAGRICYARKELIDSWKEAKIDKDGKVEYEMKEVNGKHVRVPKMINKTLNISDLNNKYAQQLLSWLAKNDKLQLALASALDTSGVMPPIIMNYYRNNPYLVGFCENGSKREKRYGARAAAAAGVAGALNPLPLESSKRFRGLLQFTIDNSLSAVRLRSEFATLVTSFTSNLDSDRGGKFMNVFINPLSQGNQIRGMFDIHYPTATGTGSDHLDFLHIGARDRHDTNGGDVMHAVHCNVTELIFTGIVCWYRDSVRFPKFKKFVNSMGDLLQFGELAPEFESPENKCRQAGIAAQNAIGFLPKAMREWLSNLPSTWRAPGPELNAAGNAVDPEHPMTQRREGSILNSAIQESGELISSRALRIEQFPASAEQQRYDTRLLTDLRGGDEQGGVADGEIRGGETEPSLAGGYGGAQLYSNDNSKANRGIVTLNGSDYRRANPVTARFGVGENVEDPRLIMQNFIALCFYLHWVEVYGHTASDDSILALFKSLRASYENMVEARQNLEKLMKTMAEESPTKLISDVTDKMKQDALGNKRAADASYLGVNVRIAKKLAKLLDIGWEKCESEAKLSEVSNDSTNNGWADKCLPHQKLFRGAALPKYTVNQLPGIADNRVNGDVLNAAYRLGADGYPERAANAAPSLANASWQIRDYDFIATTKGVQGWVGGEVAVGNPVKYTYQYDETNNSNSTFGVNTLEFRRAWRNSYTTYEGIKNRKNYMNKVGYEQMQSRIMDFHLTFAQSCQKGREYFLKMYKFSKVTNFNRDGIMTQDSPQFVTADSLGINSMEGNPNIVEDYKAAVERNNQLLRPLQDLDVCKVVLGDAQYFIYRNHFGGKPTADEMAVVNINAKTIYDGMIANQPDFWVDVVLVNRAAAAGTPIGRASQIIENNLEYSTAIPRGGTRPSTKYFGSCEPMEYNDFNMYSRRKKFLDFEKPEDELFFLGAEWFAKLYSRSRFGPEADPAAAVKYAAQLQNGASVKGDRVILRTNTAGTEGILTEYVPFAYSKDDTARREGMGGNQSLTPTERDAYSRYIIFMHKVSGGNPGKLASRILGQLPSPARANDYVTDADRNLAADAPINVLWDQLQDPRAAAPGRPAISAEESKQQLPLKAYIAMNILALSGISPLFATVGQLSGGSIVDDTTYGDFTGGETKALTGGEDLDAKTLEGGEKLEGGATALEGGAKPLEGGDKPLDGGKSSLEGGDVTQDLPVVELDAPTAELDMDFMMDDLLTGGGLRGGRRDETQEIPKPLLKRPETQVPARGRYRGNDHRTKEERELDEFLEDQGYEPVMRIKVGSGGPKLLNKFGTSESGVFIQSDTPWMQCQKQLGRQYYSVINGKIKYWYNEKAKCYRPIDGSSQARDTMKELEDFQKIARIMNNATQADRAAELEKARTIIVADPANNHLNADQIEELALEMIPGDLRALPTYAALKTASWVSEDIQSQIHEISDNTEAEQRASLMRIIKDHRLLTEEWEDQDPLVEQEHLRTLVEDMVKQANACTVVSEAIKNSTTATERREKMAKAVGQGGRLDPAYVETLPSKAKLLLAGDNFGSKCDVQNLGVNNAVLLPTSVKNRIDEQAIEAGHGGDTPQLNPVVQWWRQAYAHTAKIERSKENKLEELLDPAHAHATGEITLHKETAAQKLEKSLDPKARELLRHLQ
jgi:hypothetical protein